MQCGKIKAVAHEATNSRIWQGRTSWQGACQQHEDEISKNETKQTQELRTCTTKIQRVSRDPTSRPKEDLASSPQKSPQVRESRVKKDVGIWPTAGRISRQPQVKWDAACDMQSWNQGNQGLPPDFSTTEETPGLGNKKSGSGHPKRNNEE